ncbi:MAG: AMP-dependent synthetase/ligase [Planctomycetota bacterium]
MASHSIRNISELFTSQVELSGHRPALGSIQKGSVRWLSWNEIAAKVHHAIIRLRQAGVSQGDRVAQWAPNSIDWIFADLAILSLGAAHVPLHATLDTSQLVDQISLADPKVVVVENASELALTLQPKTLDYAELGFEQVSKRHELEVAASQLATLLFTSGTTGQPRGVMLTHENLVSNAIAVSEAVGSDTNETRLCFLPLSHIYARTCDLYSWLYRGSKLVLAESRDTIVRDCQLAKPTVINGVPYFYQKIAQQLGDAGPGALKKLFGGELKRCFCGGAAVAPEVERLFERQGLPILTGYGLTEASPVISATRHDDYRAGTVGRPMANLDVKLSDEGEILVRGPSVMQGYWQDQAATDEAILDGWLHTGDLGEFDGAGHLRIVGRQKEIIVLSTGKNVAPSRVEQLLSGSPMIEHICVVGDAEKCLGALIVPNPDAIRAEIKRHRLWVWSKKRAVTHPQIRQLYRTEIDRLLVTASAEEQVGKFAILPRNFSVEAGELTTKLSLRRKAIAGNFAAEIHAMYADVSGRP